MQVEVNPNFKPLTFYFASSMSDLYDFMIKSIAFSMSCSDLILNIEGYVSAQVFDEGVSSSLMSKDMGSFVNNRISLTRGFS